MTSAEESATSRKRAPWTQRVKAKLFEDDEEEMERLQPHISQRLTRKSEIWGYLLFGFGYFGWANSTSSIFQPLLIQGLALGASKLSSDHSIPCPKDSTEKCVVPFGWIWVDPTSYALLINVVGVVCSIFVSLGTSAWADHGRHAKKLMLLFCFLLASLTCFMFVGALKADLWWISGLLMVLGLVANACCMVYFEAHIPILARHHPRTVRALVEYGETSREYLLAKTEMAVFFSGHASQVGYLGGFVLTLIAAVILLTVSASVLTLGYCMVLATGFVLVFAVAYWRLSYQREFPPFPPGTIVPLFGYQRIVKTIRQARTLKTMFFYLACWFFLGDGLSAATSMAILIAQSQLNASNDSLIIAALIQYVTAGAGITFWIYVQNNRGVKPKTVVVANAFLFGLIPLYCLLGLIESSPIGLKSVTELYVLALFFGFFIGAIYSSNRVVFSQLIPLGHENELYALFEMASTTSSWMGPLICAAIIERASARHTWIFLATQFFIPGIMLCFLNMEKGIQEARDFYDREHQGENAALEKNGDGGSMEQVDSVKDFVMEAEGKEVV
ncbi:Autophagy protein 22 [Actinomortierella ambigua]|nr:Autophagy protein 22 [Actinomortierella ambigua]